MHAIFAVCSVSSLKTKGPYSTDKSFYSHEETINIKCDEGFQLYYEYKEFDYGYVYKYKKLPKNTNDVQINATCFHGDIYLNDSIELTEIYCEPSNYFYSCIQVLKLWQIIFITDIYLS